MIDSFWRDARSGSDPDILSEERERRRGRSNLRFVWPGNWFRGRVGVCALILFVVGGIGLAMFQGIGIGGASPPSNVEPEFVHPESGRVLTAMEYALAEQYGRPVSLGDGGLPLIRVYATDEVRELTPVEAEFDSSRRFVYAGYGGVVWTPGPRGWGMWWKDDSEERALRTSVVFSREDWRERQESELSLAVSGVSQGIRMATSMDLALWKPGIGIPLFRLVHGIKSRYPPVAYNEWGAVPGLWGCDYGIEVASNQGVTQGCPHPEYVGSLGSAWVQLGVVVGMLEKMGRLAIRMDSIGAEELYLSEYLPAQTYFTADLIQEVEGLAVALERLQYVSLDEELMIYVRLFEEPA